MFSLRRTALQALLVGAIAPGPVLSLPSELVLKQDPPPPVQNERHKSELGAHKVSERLRVAEALLAEERVEEALAEYQRAVELASPRSSELRVARFAYAQALSRLNREIEAAEQYQAAIRDNGGRDPIAYFNLGNAYARAGRNEQAVEAYRRAIEQRYGNYARAHNNLGLVLVRLGRYDEARAAYLRALALEGGYYADAHYNLSRLYLLLGESKRAREQLALALRMEPQHEDAAILWAELAEKHDPYRSEAETVVDASGEVSATRPAPATERETGHTVAVRPTTFRLLQQARAARDRGELGRAAELYQASLRAEGQSVTPIEWELAAVWSRLDRLQEASAAYRRIIAKAGDRYPMAYYNLGRLMMREEKYAGAAVLLRQALIRVGEYPYIYLALSEALERSGDVDGAIQALLKYGETRPKGEDEIEEEDWYRRKLASLRQQKK